MTLDFCWIEQGVVMASSFPSDTESLRRLRDAGAGLLINLTDQRHEAAVLEKLGLREVCLPVADFSAPPAEVLDAAITAIDQARSDGQAVAVHCQGGLGRTGTVIAAWLVTGGMDAESAIARVRDLRPGSIETSSQIRAVFEFEARVRRDNRSKR